MEDAVFQMEIRKQELGKYLDCDLEALELKSMLCMWQLLQHTLKPDFEILLQPFLFVKILPL
jgi:hypothetical protein